MATSRMMKSKLKADDLFKVVERFGEYSRRTLRGHYAPEFQLLHFSRY
jgi:hypothetical protein